MRKELKVRSLIATRDYALACRNIAEIMQIEVIDLFHGMQLCDDWETELLLADGLSLNEAGHAMLFKMLKSTIEQLIPRDRMPRMHPAVKEHSSAE